MPEAGAYLFPEALESLLKRRSLLELEADLFEPEQRTVILVFGLTGGFGNPFVTVCGSGLADRLTSLLADPLPATGVERLQRVREFRRSQSSWAEAPRWLTPEVFSVEPEWSVGGEGTEAERRRALLKVFEYLRMLLAALFLADGAEVEGVGYRIWYAGFGRASVMVDRDLIRRAQGGEHPEKIFDLYTFAFDGLSADKLEIVQQFLSLMISDVPSLFSRAEEVRDAAKKTYDRALVDRVGAYFAARHKIQDRLRTAVAETSSGIIALSREVSSDLYKVIGLIAAAVVGSLLKAGIESWAGLGASIVIGMYLGLVLAFHLPSMVKTHKLRLYQHKDFIRSFRDVLRREEIQHFLKDRHLFNTDRLFRAKVSESRWVYGLVLAAALLAALTFGNRLARGL